jgi:hypothetical protein
MNSLWDIRIFLGLVTKESPCIYVLCVCSSVIYAVLCNIVLKTFYAVIIHNSELPDNRHYRTTYSPS